MFQNFKLIRMIVGVSFDYWLVLVVVLVILNYKLIMNLFLLQSS